VSSAPVRVVVCEDSPLFARALVRALEHGGELEVVATFPTAERAIEALPALRPALVTMDLELPGMSGLEAVEEIMSAMPLPIAVLSSHVGAGTERAAAALAAGALDALAKDDLDLRDPAGASAGALRARMKVLSRARVIRHPRARLRAPAARAPAGGARSAAVIGICASTGGPQALNALLAALPAGFPVPILLVQHIAPGFTEGFARWLDSVIPLPVSLAGQNGRVGPGVHIAPEGAHLVLRRGLRTALDRDAPATFHRPSGDALLQSLAAVAGREAVGVVLTGMGRDGAEGIAAIRAAGGLTVAQDEATSAIYGMPRAAADRGAALVLGLSDIAETLAALRRSAA
jgi:two-component system, chemotaxis family, protein-glutamate methylesterase/glutaminase